MNIEDISNAVKDFCKVPEVNYWEEAEGEGAVSNSFRPAELT